jgi:hypothetical protein
MSRIVELTTFLAGIFAIVTSIFNLFSSEYLRIETIDPHEIEVSKEEERFSITGTRFNQEVIVTLESAEIDPIRLDRNVTNDKLIMATLSLKRIAQYLDNKYHARTVSVCVTEGDRKDCLEDKLTLQFLPEEKLVTPNPESTPAFTPLLSSPTQIIQPMETPTPRPGPPILSPIAEIW